MQSSQSKKGTIDFSTIKANIKYLKALAVNMRHTRDIEFHPTHLPLFISKCKTDIYREEQNSYIARTSIDICPWQTLSSYMVNCQLYADIDEFIVRPLTNYKSKNQYSLRQVDCPTNYSTTREKVLKLIEKVGLNPKEFGLHRLQSGGATRAENISVKDCLFKRHG